MIYYENGMNVRPSTGGDGRSGRPNDRPNDRLFRPVLFLEGPDGAGKSSLVSPLRRALQHRVHVWDRWYGSMWVYEPLHGHAPAVSEYVAAAEAWCAELRVPAPVAQIVLLPDAPTLEARTAHETLPMPIREQRDRFQTWADACSWIGIAPFKTRVELCLGDPPDVIAARVARWWTAEVAPGA